MMEVPPSEDEIMHRIITAEEPGAVIIDLSEPEKAVLRQTELPSPEEYSGFMHNLLLP